MSAVHRSSNTPKTGMRTHTAGISASYEALDRLPIAVRRRLADATLPICPIALLAYYRQGIDGGFDPAYVERVVLDAIINTEQTAAETLERERESWTLGEDMAASMKAAHSRRLGR